MLPLQLLAALRLLALLLCWQLPHMCSDTWQPQHRNSCLLLLLLLLLHYRNSR
jgi:hypothetical protein